MWLANHASEWIDVYKRQGLGHACGHHMQGPAILGAAKALKDAAIDAPYTITVYGTPDEESISGKVVMLENGCTFEELDVALMNMPLTTLV